MDSFEPSQSDSQSGLKSSFISIKCIIYTLKSHVVSPGLEVEFCAPVPIPLKVLRGETWASYHCCLTEGSFSFYFFTSSPPFCSPSLHLSLFSQVLLVRAYSDSITFLSSLHREGVVGYWESSEPWSFNLRYSWVHGAWDVWGEVWRVSGCICLWDVYAGDGYFWVPVLRVSKCGSDLSQSHQRKSTPLSPPAEGESPRTLTLTLLAALF